MIAACGFVCGVGAVCISFLGYLRITSLFPRAPCSLPRSTDTLGLADGSPAPNRPWWVTLYRLGAGFAPPALPPVVPGAVGHPLFVRSFAASEQGAPLGASSSPRLLSSPPPSGGSALVWRSPSWCGLSGFSPVSCFPPLYWGRASSLITEGISMSYALVQVHTNSAYRWFFLLLIVFPHFRGGLRA